MLEDCVARRFHLCLIAHGDSEGDRTVADLLGHGLRSSRVDVGDQDPVTTVGEETSDLSTEAPPGAGDDSAGGRACHRSPALISPYSMPPWT